eukprot:12143836-Alexandrium_andersonii.AAC.1
MILLLSGWIPSRKLSFSLLVAGRPPVLHRDVLVVVLSSASSPPLTQLDYDSQSTSSGSL